MKTTKLKAGRREEDAPRVVGDAIYLRRAARRWSLDDAVKNLRKQTGLKVAPRTLYGWERGQSNPSEAAQMALAQTLDCEVADLRREPRIV